MKLLYNLLNVLIVLCIAYQKRSIDLNIVHDVIFETRLSHDVLPNSYHLKLDANLENWSYSAELELNIIWYKSTKNITLHLDESVNIESIIIDNIDSNSKVENFTTNRNERKSWFLIHFGNLIESGTQYKLKFVISGKIENKTNDGFFMGIYKDTNNETKSFAATNFRPNFARKMFPCFDEPFFKAPISISILRNSHQISISNMPLTKIEKNGNKFYDHFDISPPMPVHNLGIVISEFSKVEDSSYIINNHTQINIWARNDYHSNLKNVIKKIKHVIDILENYFKMKYPLPKLDFVALPKFRNSKQADNWGLIFFRESDLSSDTNLLWKLFQECLYQWIGSLVTPSWWTDSHINKALNSFLAYHFAIKESCGKEMQNWPMTSLYSLYYEYGTNNPISRVSGLRQEILSAKTELVFRMINYTLGEKIFQSALQKFLKEKKYKIFTSDQILNYFTNEAHSNGILLKNMSVNEIVNSWILNKDRLPVITVIRNYDKNTAIIKQDVFSINFDINRKFHKQTYLWFIPIIITTETSLNFHNFQIVWMKNTSDEIVIENMPNKNNFIIVNPEEIGPFQVNYDSRNWNLLLNYLLERNNLEKIPVKTKAKLLHEVWNFAYSGMLEFDTALNFTLFLKFERDPIVWEPMFPTIDTISKKIAGTLIEENFEIFIRNLLLILHNDLQTNINLYKDPKQNHLDKTLKTFLCWYGYKPCYEESKANFEKWISMNNDYSIGYNHLCSVFKWGDDNDWERGYNSIKNFAKNRKVIERTTLLKTLTICPRDSWKIQKLLQSVIFNENDQFSENDINMILLSVIMTPNGYRTLFDFLINFWSDLKETFSSKHQIWDKIIYSATSSLKTDQELILLKKLIQEKKHQFDSAEIDIKKALKNVQNENQWLQVNQPIIQMWFKNHENDHINFPNNSLFFSE